MMARRKCFSKSMIVRFSIFAPLSVPTGSVALY
jgi:hypothetical protein